MLQEVVKQIKDAEDQAKKILALAEEQAYEIVLSARTKADEDKAAFVRDCKSTVERLRDFSTKQAQATAEQFVKARTEEARKQSQAARKNIDKAIKVIIGDIG